MAAPRPMTPIIQAARAHAKKNLKVKHADEIEAETKRILASQGWTQKTETIEKTQWVKEAKSE